MQNDQAKDKAIFVVGLMAAFFAFSAYKEELSQIRLQIGQVTPTLSSLFLAFIIILSLSAYFYALDYLKYSYPRFQNSFVFKITTFLGNFLYSFGVLFPLLVFFFWIAPAIPLPPEKYIPAIVAFDIIGGIVVALLAVFDAISKQKQRKQKEIEGIDAKKVFSLQRALQLFENKFYGESVVESFKVLEIFLREMLLEKVDIHTEGISPSRIIETATKNNILDINSAEKVNELRKMRNLAAHSEKPLTRKDAEKALQIIRSILETVLPSDT